MKLSVETRQVIIPVQNKGIISGTLSLPDRVYKDSAVILAHGAANDMTHPLLAAFADGLAHQGHPVLRFNFLYAEQKRKSPDREPLLVSAWSEAYRFLINDSGAKVPHVVAAGKSLGGRIASQMVRNGNLPVKGLIFLGYPLHRMGDTSILHDGHLYDIRIPMLFVAGTRDSLCDMHALADVLSRLKAPHDLFVVAGGDHSFHVPKSAGVTEDEIYARIVAKAVEWLASRAFPQEYPFLQP